MKYKKLIITIAIILVIFLLLVAIKNKKESGTNQNNKKISVSQNDLENLKKQIESIEIEDLKGFEANG